MKRERFLENKTRMTIQGKRYRVGNPNHPYHALYTQEGFSGVYQAMGLKYVGELAKELSQRVKGLYNEIIEGSVYIIQNKAWPSWVKVGKALDAFDRLRSYQTSSPLRDYSLLHAESFTDRHIAEKVIHGRLENHKDCLERRGEWFKTNDSVVKGIMLDYKKETEGQTA